MSVQFKKWRVGGGSSKMPLLAVIALGLSAAISSAQSAERRLDTLDYLKELEAQAEGLRREIKQDTAKGNSEAAAKATRSLMGALDNLGTVRSMAGDADGAVKAFDEKLAIHERVNATHYGGDLVKDERILRQSKAVDALDQIVSAARQQQIVILNEAHHVAYHRAFAMQLARRLRALGFEYLACETFAVDLSNVMPGPFVESGMGLYSEEPMFAKFLADARSHGWKLVSYEPNETFRNREYGMAYNLVKRIFEKDPKARVFVYVGYSHARELPQSTGSEDSAKMAAQLKRLTGIDPLTINQTTLYAHYSTAGQARLYDLSAKRIKGRLPVTFINENGRPMRLSGEDGGFDYQVAYPRYGLDQRTGRPEWMSITALGGQEPFRIPGNLTPKVGRRLIYAFPKSSSDKAIAIDTVILAAGKRPPALMLPNADYELSHEDE